jgi:hypothetical protein
MPGKTKQAARSARQTKQSNNRQTNLRRGNGSMLEQSGHHLFLARWKPQRSHRAMENRLEAPAKGFSRFMKSSTYLCASPPVSSAIPQNATKRPKNATKRPCVAARSFSPEAGEP